MERGEKRRVMIFMPPRHGKSELASRRFPAFFIGRNPERNIIAASYNSDLAGDFGREVRNIVADPRYGNLFDVHLSEDSSAANRWHTQKRGMYVAAGVGTATTGRGAHVLLIDDPFKDRESADSVVIREKVWRWYTSTAYTRLESDIDPNEVLEDDWLWRELLDEIESGDAKQMEGAVVLIQTRWHDDDLAGRLLAEQKKGGDQWEIIELPAIREVDGEPEALWSAKYPLHQLNRIKRAIGERDWSALYQQRPISDEGAIFKREWWKLWEHPEGKYPVCDYKVASLDPAYTEKEENDPSGFTVWGAFKDKDGNQKLILMSAWQRRLPIHGPEIPRKPNETDAQYRLRASPQWGLCEWVADTCRRLEVNRLLIEAKASGISVAQELRRLYANEGWGVQLMDVKGDKVARAYSVQHLFSEGLIFAPEREWAHMVQDQARSFPKAAHDDLVDSMTQALRYLRGTGLAVRREERLIAEREEAMYHPPLQPIYDV